MIHRAKCPCHARSAPANRPKDPSLLSPFHEITHPCPKSQLFRVHRGVNDQLREVSSSDHTAGTYYWWGDVVRSETISGSNHHPWMTDDIETKPHEPTNNKGPIKNHYPFILLPDFRPGCQENRGLNPNKRSDDPRLRRTPPPSSTHQLQKLTLRRTRKRA